MRSKKWWWQFFAWSLNSQFENAWMRCKRNHDKTLLLDFIRQLVMQTRLLMVLNWTILAQQFRHLNPQWMKSGTIINNIGQQKVNLNTLDAVNVDAVRHIFARCVTCLSIQSVWRNSIIQNEIDIHTLMPSWN